MAHPRLESGDLITNARLSWLRMAGPRMAKERCIFSDGKWHERATARFLVGQPDTRLRPSRVWKDLDLDLNILGFMPGASNRKSAWNLIPYNSCYSRLEEQ
jgi:hypothetical protein